MAFGPHAASTRAREALWWLWFSAATLVSFLALAWEAVSGGAWVGAQALTFGASVLALLAGTVAYLGVAGARGLLSVGWPGLAFPLIYSVFHFASLGQSARGWYRPGLLPLAWKLSVVCLLTWMAGYLLARGRERVRLRPQARHGRVRLTAAELSRIAWLGTWVFALGLGLAMFTFVRLGLRNVFLSSYMESRELLSPLGGGALAYIFAIAKLLCVVGAVIASAAGAIGAGRAVPNRVYGALLSSYLVILLLIGDRSEFSMVVFPVLLFHHSYVRRFTWRRALTLGAALFLVFGLTKAVRASKHIDDVRAMADALVTVEALAQEMGYTLDTVIRAMAVVPDDFPYFYGSTYLHAVARALPNLTFTPRTWGFVSSQWINWETAPELAARGNALGFSIVAEAYINAGLVGAPLILFALGLIHGAAERAMVGPLVSPWRVMLFTIATIGLLMHVRNTVVLYIRMGLWMAAILAGVWLWFTVGRALAQREAPA